MQRLRQRLRRLSKRIDRLPGDQHHLKLARWRTNRRLIIRSLAAACVLAIVLALWRQWMIHRFAHQLWGQAETAAEGGEFAQAAGLAYRALGFDQLPAESRVKMLEWYYQAARSPQDFARLGRLCRAALRDLSDHQALSQLAAEAALRAEQPGQAAVQAEYMLAKWPHHPPATRVLVLARYALAVQLGPAAIREVEELGREALERNPDDIELAVALATMYRSRALDEPEIRRAAQADAVMRRLCASPQAGAAAYLARFKYRRIYGLAGAGDDVAAAKRLAPDDPEVIHAEASLALDRGDWELAAPAFQRLVELRPRDPRGYLGLGESAWLGAHYAEALRAWSEGIAQSKQVQLLLYERVAEAELRLGRVAEARQSHRQARELARQSVERMNPAEWIQVRSALDILEARLEAAEGKHELAAAIYTRALSANPAVWPARISGRQQANLLGELADCYRAMGDIDLAAGTLDEVRRLEPTRLSSYLNAAAAWEAAGNLAAAAERAEQAANVDPTNPATWLLLARLELRRLRELPASERKPEAFQQALAQARAHAADAATCAVLESDLSELLGNSDLAQNQLETQLAQEPQNATLLEALALLHAKHGRRQPAEQYVARHAALAGLELRTAVLRATVLLHCGDHDEARQWLDANDSSDQATDSGSRRFESAQLAIRAGNLDEARERLRQLLAVQPSTRAYRLLAQLAIEERDWGEVAACETQLRRLEGSEGTLWRYLRALRLLESSASPAPAEIQEAGQLAERIQTQRHTWAAGHVLSAMWSERNLDWNAAVDAYQTAVELGERRPSVLGQLLKLLVEQGRYGEAGRYADLISALDDPTATGIGQETDELLLNVALRQRQLDRALELARKHNEREPNSALSWLWLAEPLLLAGQVDEAQTAVRRAVILAPNDHRCWAGLIRFFARTGQMSEIRLTIDSLLHAEPINEAVRQFALAQAYEMLGEDQPCRTHYLEAIELGPGNPTVQRAAAEFFQPRDVSLALGCWRRVVEAGPTSRLARQALIELLLTQPGDSSWREAWNLWEQAAGRSKRKPEDLRLAVRILLRRNTAAQRRQAREMLEQLRSLNGDFTNDDRFLLARLALSEGRADLAENHFRDLIAQPDTLPAYWLAYGEFLLGQERPIDAAACVEQLTSRGQRSLEILVLAARCQRALGQSDQVAPAVDNWFADGASAASFASLADQYQAKAEVYAAAGLGAEAEQWYRKASGLDPARFAPLAQFLSRQARIGESIEVCLQASAQGHTLPAALLAVQMIAERGATPTELVEIEPLVERALAEHAGAPELLYQVGTLRFIQGRADEAESLLRRVLAARPDNIPALSNLAMLVSQRLEQCPEALGLIQRAIEVGGPQEELLDTLAVLQLRLGEPQQARLLLEQIVASPSAAPTWWMHLAQAQRSAGDLPAAIASLRTAHERGIHSAVLVPAEREMLARLDRELRPE